jgi:hypothetical protein
MAIDDILLYRVMFGTKDFLKQFEQGMPIVSKATAEDFSNLQGIVSKYSWGSMASQEDRKVNSCNHPFFFHKDDVEFTNDYWIFQLRTKERRFFRGKYALPVLNMRGLHTFGTSWATDLATAHDYLNYRARELTTPMSFYESLDKVGTTVKGLSKIATAAVLRLDHNTMIFNHEPMPYLILEAVFKPGDERLIDLREGDYPLLTCRKNLHWNEMYVAGAVKGDEYKVLEKGNIS